MGMLPIIRCRIFFFSSLLSKTLNVCVCVCVCVCVYTHTHTHTHTNINLPVVLYGCETWSPTLREERRLRMFENRVLRKVFGPMTVKVTREWRKLHNEELNDLYSSPNIARGDKIEKDEMGGACSAYGGQERRIQGFGDYT